MRVDTDRDRRWWQGTHFAKLLLLTHTSVFLSLGVCVSNFILYVPVIHVPPCVCGGIADYNPKRSAASCMLGGLVACWLYGTAAHVYP